MKIVGVIAEFNPFHNGHSYFINAIREQLAPDGIVCVMSGDFVQRGYPAIADKWTRARAAVAGGVDLVLELPAVFALSAAPDFAFGGIKILNDLGCVTDLVFGSEGADIQELQRLAKIDVADNEVVKSDLKSGSSYASAFADAIGKDLEPNDILALEYLKANKSFEPHAVKRKGRGHTASASYIREHIAEIEEFVPDEVLYELGGEALWDGLADEKLCNMLKYALLMKPSYELADMMGVSEGLENSLKKAGIGASCIDDIIMNAKSKRYTYARISRILMCIALDMKKFLVDEAKSLPLYARVLAMNNAGAAILKDAKKTASEEIISNLKKADVIRAPYRNIIETDVQAADLYSILTGRDVRSHSDFVKTPAIY